MADDIEELDVPTPETDEPEQSELQEPESAPEPEDESPTPDEDAQLSERAQKRINSLTRRAYDAERRAQRLEDALLAQKPAPKPEPELTEPAPPDPDKFDLETVDGLKAFTKAQTKHIADLRQFDRDQAERRETAERKRTEQAELTQKQQRQLDWSRQGSEVHEDFDLVVGNPGTSCSQAMLDVAEKLEHGHDVLYRVMSDPAKAAEMSQMNASDVALEMAKMAQPAPKPKAGGKPPPTPPNPARGKGDTPDAGRPEDAKDIDDYMRRYHKTDAAKRLAGRG